MRELCPHCPPGREAIVSAHACLKYSGWVGRSSAARSLDETAVRLAVVAHIRHTETEYATLLARGYERREARTQVETKISHVRARWEGSVWIEKNPNLVQ